MPARPPGSVWFITNRGRQIWQQCLSATFWLLAHVTRKHLVSCSIGYQKICAFSYVVGERFAWQGATWRACIATTFPCLLYTSDAADE